MELAADIGAFLVAAAEEEGGGSFLVSPGLGLMIWTLIAFLATFFILKRLAYPRIQEALEKRANAVAESIDAARRSREEAEQLLQEYRERLREAREQADDIVARARQSSERFAEESKTEAKHQREEMMEQTRREIDQETRRALGEIRREVADLTIAATEKVMRKSLDEFADELDQNRDLQIFLFSPYFSSQEKKDGIRKIVVDADERFLNFLELLAERHRMPAIFRIRRAYDALWRQENKLLPVTVTSAVELDEGLVKGIGERIEEQTGKKVELTSRVDADVL